LYFCPVAIPTKKITLKKSPKKKKSAKRGSLPLKWIVAIIALVALALSPFYYGYVVKTLTSTLRWTKDIGNKPHYRTYKSFGIRIPDKYRIHGIDVSQYQGIINWQKVKKMQQDSVRISFAFIKATEGIVITDPYFQRNWRECKKAGLTCGAYHYFRPKYNGKLQAKFLLQNVTPKKGDLPIVVDVESLDGTTPEQMRLQLTAFLQVVTAKTKAKPIIYSGLKFYEDNLAGFYPDYLLWLSNFDHPDLAVSPATNWRFWQHSFRARVSGIYSRVDFDAFKGDSLAFRKMLVP